VITRRGSTRRPGITLTEALIALFIAAIGLICLMTLFPLAALQMGQAMKDERCGQLAMQADQKLRWYWKTHVIDGTLGQCQAMAAMDDPDGSTGSHPQAGNTEISYPVFLDPIGWVSRPAGNARDWVGENVSAPNFGIPRKNLFNFGTSSTNNPYGSSGIDSVAKAVQCCSLLDDLTYDTGGAPGGTVERQGRYNFAAVVQKPTTGLRTTATLKIVVYDGRAPGYAPLGKTELIMGTDATNQANNIGDQLFEVGATNLTNTYGAANERPPLRKGGWVLDATTVGTEPNNGNASVTLRHANFYRVVSVNDETAGTLVLELQTPITRSDGKTGTTRNYNGTLLILDGVAEVFERPQLSPAQGP
jgi:hypothetical protein